MRNCMRSCAHKYKVAGADISKLIQAVLIQSEGMKRLLAAVLLFGLVGGLRGSPFFNQQLLGVGTGADPGQVSFDAGPVDSCEVPTTCVCGVEYEVPSSVATIAAAIEMDIDSTYDSNFEILHGASCRNATRRIVCAQRFPRCVTREDGTKQVELTSLQCAEELTNQCSPGADLDRLMERTCGVEDSTWDIGECRSVTQYAAESSDLGWFEQCTLSDRWQVTAWMYGYLKYYELAAREATRDLDYSAVCLERLANFTCQWIGRCSASGDSVELINTHQFCEQTINW